MEKHKIKSDSQAFRLVSYFITTQKGIFINMWIAKVNISLSTLYCNMPFGFQVKRAKSGAKSMGVQVGLTVFIVYLFYEGSSVSS